jgi:hypothetical protein
MRKLLLASAAVIGATVGLTSFASAQTTNLPPSPMQGGFPTAPGGVSPANNNNNYQAAMLPPGPTANPVPGSIVTRIAARVVFYTTLESSSLDVTKGVGPLNTGAAKLSPYDTLGYARLYFGMDGLTTNGLRYGGSIEIRANTAPATGSTTNNQSSANTTGDTLYVRRAFGYVANDRVGIFRFGQADGPWGIFENGVTTFQGFDDGGWNGDIPGSIPGNSQPVFPFLSQQGAEYGSSKLVYLSPQFFGFDFGFSWAPNNASLQNSNCSFAATGCYNLSSSSSFIDGARFTNMYEAAARYQNTFGPVGIYAMGGYMGSGHVNYTSLVTPATPAFNNLSVGIGGLALTIGGVTFGGTVQGGAVNGIGALQPKGGVHGIAWIAGIQYSTGPFTIGNHFFAYDSQGAPALVGITQRHEMGYAVGMTYGIAPGLSLWVSYVYGQRHQGDYNFQTGAVGSAAYNDVKGQAFGVGTIVKW